MSKTLCPLPWIHLATHPVGEVSVCCKSDMADSSGHAKHDHHQHRLNLSHTTIDEIRNSDSFKKIRLQMLNGEIPKACTDCFVDEKKGLKSKRIRETEEYPLDLKTLKEMTAPDGSITNQLQFLELRLGNRCNMKCITCNPMSSSFWNNDALALKEKFKLDLPHDYLGTDESLFAWPDQEHFWNQIKQHSSSIDRIYINGGEPTLNTKHWGFLEDLIAQDKAKNIELLYNINMTNLPDELVNLWRKFKKVIIHASIDDTHERNEYIRFPSRWSKIEENFKKVNSQQFEIEILQTISCFNFFTLNKLSQWLNLLAPKVTITYNFVSAPAYFSPLIIPPAQRKKALLEYQDLPVVNYEVAFRKYFTNEYLETERKQFISMVEALDEIRQTNYQTTFPELTKALQLN